MIIKNLKIQILEENSLKMYVGAGFERSSTLGAAESFHQWKLKSFTLNFYSVFSSVVLVAKILVWFRSFGSTQRVSICGVPIRFVLILPLPYIFWGHIKLFLFCFDFTLCMWGHVFLSYNIIGHKRAAIHRVKSIQIMSPKILWQQPIVSEMWEKLTPSRPKNSWNETI